MSVPEIIGLIAAVVAIGVTFFGAVNWFRDLQTAVNLLQHQHTYLARSYLHADEDIIKSIKQLRRKNARIERYLSESLDYPVDYDED